MMDFQAILRQFLLPAGFAFMLAWLIRWLGGHFIERFVGMSDYAPEGFRMRNERRRTLQNILTSALSLGAFAIASLFSLGLLVDATTLIWMIGLFSAAFGIGSNKLIADFLTGITFIFEDSLDVGDKVEINGVEGVVEALNLRMLILRAPTGELFYLSNGEVRMIRNFSRGKFSPADILLKIHAAQMGEALSLLDQLKNEALTELPNLIEPWLVVNEAGTLGEHVQLKIVAKAKFGKAAEMRPRLLAWLQNQFSQAGIGIVN